MEKKEYKKIVIEVINFENNDNIVTSISASGEICVKDK